MSEEAQELDARGLNCPLPIIRAKKAIQDLAEGEVLKLVATDPGANKDVESFCTQSGNELLSAEEQDGTFVFYLKKN